MEKKQTPIHLVSETMRKLCDSLVRNGFMPLIEV